MDGLVVLSPHLDDAVLSCGQFLAGRPGTTVCTLFAGTPHRKRMLTTYDHTCGFRSAGDAMVARRAEDRRAMEILGAAKPQHLQFLDGQYRDGRAVDVDTAAAEFLGVVEYAKAFEVMGPLGISHPDHEAARLAYAAALRERPELKAWVYEDLPSRVVYPTDVPPAIQWWREQGFDPVLAFPGTGPKETKREAVEAYASQLAALTVGGMDEHCWLVPERYWLIREAS